MAKNFLLKSAFWLTLSEIVFNLSGYIVHSGVGRILGPADYGRYGLVITLTTTVIILIGKGIPTAMSKYVSEVFEAKPEMVRIIRKKAAILQVLIVGSITLIFYLSIPLIAHALNDPTLIPLFRISVLIIPAFAMASFYVSFFSGLHLFKLQSILKTVRSVAKVVTIITLAFFLGIEGSIIGYILAPFIVFIAAYLIDITVISPKFSSGSGDDFPWKKLIYYAWPVTLFMLFYEILISVDLYLVKGILQDDFLTGIYNASLTIGRLPYYIFYALTILLLPVISKTTAENKIEETQTIISRTLRIMVTLLFPGVIMLSVFSQPIIRLFFGKGYEQASLPLSILAIGVGFLTIFYIMSFVLNGAGKVSTPMWISFFGVILNIGLNVIMIPKYGIAGSAMATSITSVLIMTLILFSIKKNFGSIIKAKSLAKIASSSFSILVLSSFLPRENLYSILWTFPLLMIYFFLLFVMKEFSSKDITFARNLIFKKK